MAGKRKALALPSRPKAKKNLERGGRGESQVKKMKPLGRIQGQSRLKGGKKSCQEREGSHVKRGGF